MRQAEISLSCLHKARHQLGRQVVSLPSSGLLFVLEWSSCEGHTSGARGAAAFTASGVFENRWQEWHPCATSAATKSSETAGKCYGLLVCEVPVVRRLSVEDCQWGAHFCLGRVQESVC